MHAAYLPVCSLKCFTTLLERFCESEKFASFHFGKVYSKELTDDSLAKGDNRFLCHFNSAL